LGQVQHTIPSAAFAAAGELEKLFDFVDGQEEGRWKQRIETRRFGLRRQEGVANQPREHGRRHPMGLPLVAKIISLFRAGSN
jgi:hypothetical protein